MVLQEFIVQEVENRRVAASQPPVGAIPAMDRGD